MYRVATTHRIPYLFRSLPAKTPIISGSPRWKGASAPFSRAVKRMMTRTNRQKFSKASLQINLLQKITIHATFEAVAKCWRVWWRARNTCLLMKHMSRVWWRAWNTRLEYDDALETHVYLSNTCIYIYIYTYVWKGEKTCTIIVYSKYWVVSCLLRNSVSVIGKCSHTDFAGILCHW